ncbi:putative ribosome quality control (RQC) complex YloA/Tae2 family protein [Arthrobacter sp. JUb119]|uniref:hypothetical protein n=1 Tax=unclassified Glutamicibacter TaxID=2627139 RepID=UPI002A3308CD|nr:putative ribosome quality control (RQC) complex YloA/Tae2 family protein [Arthrobacter sp. JUb119]
MQQYAGEQVSDGTRPRKRTEALIERIKGSAQTSEPASAAIEDIMSKLQRIKQQQASERQPPPAEHNRATKPTPEGPQLS